MERESHNIEQGNMGEIGKNKINRLFCYKKPLTGQHTAHILREREDSRQAEKDIIVINKANYVQRNIGENGKNKTIRFVNLKNH